MPSPPLPPPLPRPSPPEPYRRAAPSLYFPPPPPAPPPGRHVLRLHHCPRLRRRGPLCACPQGSRHPRRRTRQAPGHRRLRRNAHAVLVRRRPRADHSLLRQGNEEYDAKRVALYEHYHPIEICPDIPLPEKAKLMEEWWEKTHGLLIEGGLTYEDIKKSVFDAVIAFRDGVVELFEYLEERDIPVLVFSAGLADIIEEVFRQKLHRPFKNVKVVSNRMVFNEEGRLVSFKGKTIHVLNKNEHALDMAAPVHDNLGDPNGSIDDYSLVRKRTNVLLLGDHIGDLGMSDGLNYENRIAVGFLNANIEKSLNDYSKAFDVVYLNDAPMRGVVELVSELCP
ncbi:cytosolic 5'-nucleotidase 3-like isoform X3 [Panicum virgatum]|uniref:5'-nucleotidase n=1 Tax=Panicum virgatum TaxID=38727 RepID=A0A8T0MG97_PANVG|nr:cytosolic 5'-nucleotidase 3-like isoform X3 [Panicum virgatum]KAG2536350.1 hypothetical protein PVAP13_9NG182600 [Panicum virgatum]